MTNRHNAQRGGLLRRWSFWLTIAVLTAVVGVTYAALNGRMNETSLDDQSFYDVKQGPLTISVTESGTIRPREQIIIKSEVEGQTLILFLIPEGTQVKKGDLLVELDATALQDQLVDQQIRVQNAEAAYIGARENLEVVKNQAQSDIDIAKLDYRFAKQDLEKYEEGEFPKLRKEADAEITMASEELSRSQEELKWSQILFDEEYLSQSDLTQDQLTAKKAELNLQLANADLDLLTTYTYERQMAEYQSNVKQTEMALERTNRKAAADIVQAEAELLANKSEFERETSKLKKNEEQIAKAKVYAPMDGLAIYATSVRSSFRGNNEPLEEGQSVRERQELVYLPTTAAYKVEVKIHESSLDKIRPGLPALVKIDALPGKRFTGHVTKIAPLPDSQSIFLNPDLKVYNTEVEIEGNGADLRNGMSCSAEIVVEQYEDATYIPIQAILRIGGKPSVYTAEGDHWEPRPVEVGLDNNRVARIISGLKEGERVLLTPPLASGGVEDVEPYADLGELPPPKPDAPAAGPDRPGGGGPGGPGDRSGGGGPPGAERGEGGRNGAERGEGRRGGNRGGFQNMTPEQREEMRKRFENMTPEQREAMRQRRQQGGERSQGEQGGGRPQRNRGSESQ